VRIEYLRPNEVYEQVLAGNADLGLVAYQKQFLGLQTVHVRKEPWALISHPDQPLGKRTECGLEVLNGRKFISFEPDRPTRLRVQRALSRHRAEVKPEAQFDNVDLAKRAVAAGLGVSLVPLDCVATESDRRSLWIGRLKADSLSRPLAVVCRKTASKHRKAVNDAAKKLITLLKDSGYGENL
jgi:DNA-binding transcriptional LysR family regulator